MSDLTQKFYDTFGIEKRYITLEDDYGKFQTHDKLYPEITAEKLLEMICLLGTVIRHFKIPPKLKLEQLKYHILRNCITEQEGIYTRIQQLFKD